MQREVNFDTNAIIAINQAIKVLIADRKTKRIYYRRIFYGKFFTKYERSN